MKSNLTQKEIDSGRQTIDLLQRHDSLLSPHILKKLLFKYKHFSPDINKYGIWISSKFTQNTNQKYDKIVFLLNGLAASGKDSIYNEMINLSSKLFFKTVTATSRPPRENETDKIDYFFYKNTSVFKTDIKNGEFIEYLKRGDTYYGLPKKSFKYALKQSKPIIYCQIEMSGWARLEKYLVSLNKNILVIKSFVLPNMTISEYLTWLVENRGKEEINSRINKSGWELNTAPKKVDFFIINRINSNLPTLTYTAKTTINFLIPYLKSTKIKKFLTPTDNLKYTKDTSEIVKIHDLIV